MKKTLTSVILLAGTFLAFQPAFARDVLDFTLVNRTGYTINEVYVSPISSDAWEEDIMGRDQLANGESVDIHFSKGAKGCKWDLKVTYEDKEEAEWEGFDLCSVSKIVLRYDRKKGETWAEYQ
ncbi:MAG: hypothetical protein PHI49_09950 [Halothiobacillaceae bacterium]|jgi:hypothetical protein|nr:hypothetical protein [Halothiobacillaceae bacterium]